MRHPSGMLIQSDGSKPFVKSLMGILADEFTWIIFKMGGFVDRDIRGKPGVKSMHASGRAIDIYLDVRKPQEKALGKLLYGFFKTNAAMANTGHVIFDGLIWAPGAARDRSTSEAGVRDVHDDHVHVDFETAAIMASASRLIGPLHALRTRMEGQGYKEWLQGWYGPAFNPTSHNHRLSDDERRAIYTINKGTTSMSLDPAYLRARDRADKWRRAGKLPDPAGLIQS